MARKAVRAACRPCGLWGQTADPGAPPWPTGNIVHADYLLMCTVILHPHYHMGYAPRKARPKFRFLDRTLFKLLVPEY